MTTDDEKNTQDQRTSELVFTARDFMHELSNRTQNGALRYLNYVDAEDCARWANLKICVMQAELRRLRDENYREMRTRSQIKRILATDEYAVIQEIERLRAEVADLLEMVKAFQTSRLGEALQPDPCDAGLVAPVPLHSALRPPPKKLS